MQQKKASGDARGGGKESMNGRRGSGGRVEVDPATPVSSASSSQKSTCLRRKKKSRSRMVDSDGDVQMEISSQESDWEITKKLDFDDVSLSDSEPVEPMEMQQPQKSSRHSFEAKSQSKSKAQCAAGAKTGKETRAHVPIRNTCILDSPLDRKRSHRKRRIYGVRRGEPELTCKRQKKSVKRPLPFAICSLQRMFAP